MKKLLSLILIVASSNNLSAQEELPYKPLSEFKTDTAAFMKYNFIDTENYYIGKTLGDVLDDMQIPVKAMDLSSGYGFHSSSLFGLYLDIRNRSSIDRHRERENIRTIIIHWEEPIEMDEYLQETRLSAMRGLANIDSTLEILRGFDNKILEVTLLWIPDEEYYDRHSLGHWTYYGNDTDIKEDTLLRKELKQGEHLGPGEYLWMKLTYREYDPMLYIQKGDTLLKRKKHDPLPYKKWNKEEYDPKVYKLKGDTLFKRLWF